MNYHTALQRKDGKWDFTTNGHPTGYCHRLRFGKMAGKQVECKICKEWTQIYAELDCSLIPLCDKHANREFVDQIYNAPTEMWTS